ncbi:MAG: pirin family protein [Acidobacteriota bacterium]
MKKIPRREALEILTVGAAGALGSSARAEETTTAPVDPVLATAPLDFPWPTADPFLFCAHHDDRYPAGNGVQGPVSSLEGRNLGQDFTIKDGWRMYHGETVPGFPEHPHRGFETVTVVQKGLVDHSDSLGAVGRYGHGDVQWMTAGSGLNHSEMFPLVHADRPNHLELFQVWLNLPRRSKMVAPHFKMFWRDQVGRSVSQDAAGGTTEVSVIAGQLGDARSPSPPPDSWAAQADSDVAIWTIDMEPGAIWELPPARAGSNRTIYFHAGSTLKVGPHEVASGHLVELRPDVAVPLVAGAQAARVLLLQGRPIGEPVARHGPFVMTTQDEIRQTIRDYQRTQFGGWPWSRPDPVHAREEGRFARHADGKVERPT